MTQQRLFAFWKYDLFPYILGSEIERFLPDGLVQVKGYGGATFKPCKILTYEEGAKLLDQLNELEVKFKQEEKSLKAKYQKLANFILKL